MEIEKTFTTLANIKKSIIADQQNNTKQFSTAGVIIDSTNPCRKSRDYCMKLKIIDLSTSEPCQVFLYARSIDQFPKNIKFGDIILLQKYGFQLWNDVLQAKKQFKVFGSEFRFYSGQPSLNTYGQIGSQSPIDDFDSSIIKLLNQLRKHSQNYFKNNKIQLYNKSSKQSSDFDMIVKVISSQKINQCYKIHLTNTVNQFQINYSYQVRPQIYKLRSIAQVQWNGKKGILIGNDYTSFLQLSQWMKSYDSKNWQKISAPGKSTQVKAQRQKIQTKILNQKKNQKRQQTTLKQLVQKDIHDKQVSVVVQFVQCFTNFRDALKKYDQFNHLQKNYQSGQGKYIYNIHYAVTDKSLQNQIFNVYVFTYDQRGKQFLPNLQTEKIYGKNILSFQQKFNHINNRLLQQTSIQSCPVKLILSPLSNGKGTVYRIVDTQLLI